MTLNYDFDIFDLVPKGLGQDPETTGFLRRLGLLARKGTGASNMADIGPNQVALFRELQTADALRAAPKGLRDYFLTAGFGLNTYCSGAPRHHYPATDENARLEIIERLTVLAPSHTLPEPGDYPEGGAVFRLGAFLADLGEARPWGQGPASHPDLAPPEADDTLQLAPTFDTHPEMIAVPRRKFWQNRYFAAAVAVGLAVAVWQMTASYDVINMASL